MSTIPINNINIDDKNKLFNEQKEEKKEEFAEPNIMKSKQSSLSFSIEKAKKQLIINSNLINKCNISFYGMNTELLFSINPFTFTDNKNNKNNNNSNDKNAFYYIRPGLILSTQSLENNKNTIIDIAKLTIS